MHPEQSKLINLLSMFHKLYLKLKRFKMMVIQGSILISLGSQKVFTIITIIIINIYNIIMQCIESGKAVNVLVCVGYYYQDKRCRV